MRLTPGSVILHKFALRQTSVPDAGAPPKSIGAMARGIAASRLFAMCDAQAGLSGVVVEPPVFLSRNGVTVRVHRAGAYTRSLPSST